MPIVIHELVVTAELEQKIGTSSDNQDAPSKRLDREEIIRECTEQVIKQLERQKER